MEIETLDVMKKAIDESFGPMAKAFREQVSALESKLDAEVKHRTDLELKLGRMNLSGGFGSESGEGALQKEHEAIGAFLKAGDQSKLFDVKGMSVKGMSVGDDPSGGFLVLPEISAAMTKKIYDQSAIRRLARVVAISGSAFEEVIDADEAGASWVGEKQARPETTAPKVGKLYVPLHEIEAAPQVTQKLLDTSYVDIGAWLTEKITDKFARSEGEAFITGNGVAKPTGFLDRAPVSTADATRAWGTLQYTASGGASGFASSNPGDALKTLLWSLRAPYRSGAVWLMNSNTASSIDKFKDGQGNYLWSNSSSAGVPPTLLGYPVEFDENMPDVGANALPIAFGNFKLGYVIPELPGIRMLRDPYTAKPNVIFYAYKRVGGDIANSEAIKLLKIATS